MLNTESLAIALFCVSTSVYGELQPVRVEGEIESPNEQFGENVDYELSGDTVFGWKTRRVTGDIDIGAFTFTMETGGGNVTHLSGAVSGQGRFVWNGGGSPSMQTEPSFLDGREPNTMSGEWVLKRGTLALAKPDGATAIAGPLIIGGGSNQAIVRLDANHQINDAVTVTMRGHHPARLWLNGHDETMGSLALHTDGEIDFGEGGCVCRFADSAKNEWAAGKQLMIVRWNGKPEGGGTARILFGDSGASLTDRQRAAIGFTDPAGLPAGVYRAKQLSTGEIVPAERVEAVNPPFDVSSAAVEARRKIYDIPGLAGLTGAESPLKKDMTIAFFGDSITWQKNYIRMIDDAIQSSDHTKKLNVQLLGRGINGAGVLDVRDGVKDFFDQTQPPFTEVLAKDEPDVAVIFIGVNDVMWRGTSPDDFRQGLLDLVTAARANQAKPVLATLTVKGELPFGRNADDEKLDAYAQITREVALEMNVTLIDLRRVYDAYLKNHNATLKLDGSLTHEPVGILTYDGVHPSEPGNRLLAEHIADGIARAFEE